MKHCPSCKTDYADETLSFCMQDGTPLVAAAVTPPQTVIFDETEAQTVVRSPRAEPVNFNLQETQAQNRQQQQSQVTRVAPQFQPPQQPPTKESNTAKAVLLTAFVMLLLFGAGFGAWLFLNKDKGDIAENKNQGTTNKPNGNTNSKPTPSPGASATPTASPTPTPKPDFNPEDVKSEVAGTVNSWKSAAESLNLNSYMNNYADTVDYYNSRGASRNTVRNDKQRAFSTYDSMEIDISNMRVTPGDAGDTATAVFDKEWVFEGADKYSEGKVQTQLQLVKSGSKWLIRAEKDLKVYYTKK